MHYVYAAELISLAEEGRRAALGQTSTASAGGPLPCTPPLCTFPLALPPLHFPHNRRIIEFPFIISFVNITLVYSLIPPPFFFFSHPLFFFFPLPPCIITTPGPCLAGGGNSVKRFLKGLSLGNKHTSTGGSSTSNHPHTQRTHVPRINFSPGGLAQAQGLAQSQPNLGSLSQQGPGLGHVHVHENGSQSLKHTFSSSSTSTLAQVTGAAPPQLGNLPGIHFGRLLRQCLAVSR